MRIALAQINSTVGDIGRNSAAVVRWARQAHQAKADLVVFPEMVLVGYPIEDLALRASFRDASIAALRQLAVDLAAHNITIPVVVGYLDATAEAEKPQNCAAVLHQGHVQHRYAKHHLPNYGVFDEFRIFTPGEQTVIFTVADRAGQQHRVGLAICEDLWQADGPVTAIRDEHPDLLVVLNGSPFEADKHRTREQVVARRAAELNCPVAYVNLIGGQDDLVFDGGSFVMDAGGCVTAQAPRFVEHLLLAELPVGTTTTLCAPGAAPELPNEPIADQYAAAVLGLRDYVAKNGFTSVILGLSGGIDSALVAAISCDAVGAANVVGVSLPSAFSSPGSLTDAEDLAKRTGLTYQVVPIEPMVQPFMQALGLTGLAAENLQARVRGVILMGLANQHGHLVLTTGNKSELAVGYSTIYGDSVGGYNPIKDLLKTQVWQAARWRNAHAEVTGEQPPIPESSITKEPSAELRDGQRDTDSLPSYDVLDAVLHEHLIHARGSTQLTQAGFEPEVVRQVIALVDRAEWKRRQSAPGPKLSPVAFGRDRRLPITTAWREPDLSSSLDNTKVIHEP